jgi:hypothetical protein
MNKIISDANKAAIKNIELSKQTEEIRVEKEQVNTKKGRRYSTNGRFGPRRP